MSGDMLKQRIITAVILLAILVAALSASAPWPFALVTLVLIAAAGWEWGRLNAASPSGAVVLALCVAALSLGLGWLIKPTTAAWIWSAAAALWIAGGAVALQAGSAGWAKLQPALRCLIGVILLAAAWAALFHAHSRGINFLLSSMALVWVADIAAYFGGRRFGRRKLAPTISPGKSWEGVVSGMLGAVALAGVWLWLDRTYAVDGPSLYSHLLACVGVVGLLLSVLALVAMSVVGDLFESLIKRAAGAKDSSGLLPGHGGVLDRVDALLPVMPMALALGSM